MAINQSYKITSNLEGIPKIKIFTTGGTIDKIYFDAKNEFQVGDPEIGFLLKEAKVNFKYSIESLLKKDSLDLTDEDRQLIYDKVINDESEKILITHGTDTMIKTAQKLQAIEGKTIVITGSMQPAKLRLSDAVFNVGAAVMAVQLLNPGIYISMNGQVFDPNNSVKNVEENRFENIK